MYMSNSPLNNQFPLDVWFVMIIFFLINAEDGLQESNYT